MTVNAQIDDANRNFVCNRFCSDNQSPTKHDENGDGEGGLPM